MSPGVRHLAALEDDVIDRPLGEEVTDRKAGVAGPDDDRRAAFDGEAPSQAAGQVLTTSTVTFVGLVTMS